MGKGSPPIASETSRAALAFTAHGEQLGADRKSATMTHFTICDKANRAINHHGEHNFYHTRHRGEHDPPCGHARRAVRLLLADLASTGGIPGSLVIDALHATCPLDTAPKAEPSPYYRGRHAMRDRQRYPKEWHLLATQCKDHAGWRCERCGVRQGTLRYSLRTEREWPVWLHAAHVHHDHDNAEPELICVCPSCHWITTGRTFCQPGPSRNGSTSSSSPSGEQRLVVRTR